MAFQLANQGQWGFTATPAGAQGAQFTIPALSAALVNPEGAWWTVTLCAWQAVSGQTPALPPGLVAKLTLGGGGPGGGAQEIVRVDYPAVGGVLTTNAASIRVDIEGAMPGDNSTIPILSGWLGMGRASARAMQGTLTDVTVNVPDTTTVIVQIPARARAWRWQPVSNPGGVVFSAQYTNQQTTPFLSGNDLVFDGSSIEWKMPENRAAWFPIPGGAQRVHLTANGGTVVGHVQWLIELG